MNRNENSHQNSNTVLLQTAFGELAAERCDGVLRVSGIRYAKSQRFGLPTAVSPNEAFNNRPEKPVVCPQPVYPMIDRMITAADQKNFLIDESPQFLTITFPENFIKSGKIPVVIWIHGGSYEIGAGDLPTFNPSRWVREQQVIVVSVTFRLGIFGFLGGDTGRPANLGLLDIIEALKWVKNYSTFFNGDPENVTVLGQSSGGDTVAHLMLANLPEGLFQKVIIQSAPLGLRRHREKMIAEFLRKTETFKDDPDAINLVRKAQKVYPSVRKFHWPALMPFGIHYGHAPLCSEAKAPEVWRQNARKYKFLIGLNHDETAFYAAASQRLLHFSKQAFSRRIIKKLIRYSTEKIYGKPAKKLAENLKEGGGSGYFFRIHGTADSTLGAPHCYDLPLLFGDRNAWQTAALLKDCSWEILERKGIRLRELWADFARYGKIEAQKVPDFLSVREI